MDDDTLTIAELITAREQCAAIVVRYGERYLPIFERLENEVLVRKKQYLLFERAQQIARKNGTQYDTQNGTQMK